MMQSRCKCFTVLLKYQTFLLPLPTINSLFNWIQVASGWPQKWSIISLGKHAPDSLLLCTYACTHTLHSFLTEFLATMQFSPYHSRFASSRPALHTHIHMPTLYTHVTSTCTHTWTMSKTHLSLTKRGQILCKVTHYAGCVIANTIYTCA